jgi:hypothetical protein
MSSGKSRPELVKEMWDVLVRVRRPITYGELANMLSSPGYRLIPQSMPQLLNPIKHYCDIYSLPRLNDLVANQRTGRPTYAPPGYNYQASKG